jgi:EAL domain-containing protein (putative c-di-GMP-specific phosphodiesterase class I)/CHASE2 domain-containing sensor protein
MSKSTARTPAKPNPRLRIFLWAFIISLICGAIEFGEPLEDVIKAGRDYIRRQPASGSIVVVGVDDRTGADMGGFGFDRRVDAQVIENLFAMGAKRVFFDRIYADNTTPAADHAFIATLKRHRGRVFLGAASPWVDGKSAVETIPAAQFRAVAGYRSLNGLSTPFTLSANLTYSDTFEGRTIPSVSSELSGVPIRGKGHYRPDWSIRIESIPSFSFSDIYRKRIRPDQIAGRDVLIGWTDPSFRDMHNILSQGIKPGVFFHVVGAETLRRGTPTRPGWLPAFAFGTALSIICLLARHRSTIAATVAAAALGMGVVPLYLDHVLIEVDVVPGALLFGIVAYRITMLRRQRETRRHHPASGLPNLVALEEDHERNPGTLIAAKLRNHSEIAASFEVKVEREIYAEIRRRIGVSGDASEIYHGDDALLWFTPQPMGQELANHLTGLHKLTAQSIRIGDREVDLLLSFGVDADPERPLSSRIGSAILSAEEAARGNDVWKLYDPQRLHQAAWQLSLMSRLGQAIETGEVWVAYQPKVDMATRDIVGAEALVRWLHPTAGAISPEQFVAAAEAHNRIGQLTYFVLETALRDLAGLRAAGHDIGMAVNLSSQMLDDADLVQRVETLLARYGVPRAKLTLEITETGELLSTPAKIAMMEKLAATGVQISIDDYGTGNATLEYLSRLPSQEVKIDRTFISDLDRNAQNLILVRSTLEMAHNLGRRVVAEGVENEAVMRLLRELGCDIAQGYLIGKPLPCTQLSAMLSADTTTQKLRVVIS